MLNGPCASVITALGPASNLDTRDSNARQLPAAAGFAGGDMRLAPGAYQEMHWHTINQIVVITKGSARLSARQRER